MIWHLMLPFNTIYKDMCNPSLVAVMCNGHFYLSSCITMQSQHAFHYANVSPRIPSLQLSTTKRGCD